MRKNQQKINLRLKSDKVDLSNNNFIKFRK